MGKLRPRKGNDLRPPNEEMTGVPTPDLVNSRPLLQSLIAQSPQNKRNRSATSVPRWGNGSGRKVGTAMYKPQDEARNHPSPLPPSPSFTSEHSTPHVSEQGHHPGRRWKKLRESITEPFGVCKMLSAPSRHLLLKQPCAGRERENTTASTSK